TPCRMRTYSRVMSGPLAKSERPVILAVARRVRAFPLALPAIRDVPLTRDPDLNHALALRRRRPFLARTELPRERTPRGRGRRLRPFQDLEHFLDRVVKTNMPR